MHLKDEYEASDVMNHQQPCPPSENFSFPSNFPMAASSPNLLDQDPQQNFLQHQLRLFSDNQHQFLQPPHQPSDMIAPNSKFRVGIEHQNGNVLPHNLIGLSNGHGAPNPSPSSATFWSSNSNGLPEQNFHTSQRIEAEQGFCNGNAVPEFQNQNGSGLEFHGAPNLPIHNSSNSVDGYANRVEKQLAKLQMMTQSFENRVLLHQDRLFEQFMEKIEQMEKERNAREELWRAAQAAARAEEQAAASSREAALLCYLERLTGEKIQVPEAAGGVQVVAANSGARGGRWPREEVDALIRVRSEMEPKFQDSGMKTSLWEEMSVEMGKLGYKRDAKRCKEKWENITKYYFRKSKDGEGGEGEEEEVKGKGTKRRFKTCAYFDQLDQYYSIKEADNNNSEANVKSTDPSTSSQTQNMVQVDQSEEDGEGKLLMESMLEAQNYTTLPPSKEEEIGDAVS